MAAAQEESLETHDSSVRPRSYRHHRYQTGFLESVGDLQKAGVLQDVVLEVEGRRFPCHKLVLCAASPYFRAMFTSGMAESRQKTVCLQGLDATVFEEILSYIYSGTLHVSLDKVQPLYQAADLLQVDYVRETCTSYMAMNVERSTCLDLYKFADTFSVEIVKDRCLQCICSYFAEVSTTAEFCSLTDNQLTNIISQDELDIDKETTVWEAVVRWVEHSREDRQKLLPSILPHVRFNLMTPEDTAAILEHPLVMEDSGSSEVIKNLAQKGTSDMKTRLGMNTYLDMVILFRSGYDSKEMLCMNPRIGRYISCQYVEDWFTVVVATVTNDNDIYILAHGTTLTRENMPNLMAYMTHPQLSLLRYDDEEHVWERKSSVVRTLGGDSPDDLPYDEILLEVQGHLYYLAVMCPPEGIEGIAFLWMRRYDRDTNQWQECSRLRLRRASDNGPLRGTIGVSCGPYLYFFTDTRMYRYNPQEDQWSKLTRPKTSLCVGVAMGTEIFFLDYNFVSTSVYNTDSNSWRYYPALNYRPPQQDGSRLSIANIIVGDRPVLFVLENQLYAFTCSNGIREDSWRLYVFDRATGVWRLSNAALPNRQWDMRQVCCVARMYLPTLTANGVDA